MSRAFPGVRSLSGCSGSVPSGSGIGGPAPYEQTLSYDTGGTTNGSTQGTTGRVKNNTLITGLPGSQNTTATVYAYPSLHQLSAARAVQCDGHGRRAGVNDELHLERHRSPVTCRWSPRRQAGGTAAQVASFGLGRQWGGAGSVVVVGDGQWFWCGDDALLV